MLLIHRKTKLDKRTFRAYTTNKKPTFKSIAMFETFSENKKGNIIPSPLQNYLGKREGKKNKVVI